MRMFGFALLLLISCCHGATESVYEQPLPDRYDTRAMSAVASQLKPEDKAAWKAIVALLASRTAAPLRSRTIGEAITRWKAQHTCLEIHARGQELAGTDNRARNREIDAYNDCLDMEI